MTESKIDETSSDHQRAEDDTNDQNDSTVDTNPFKGEKKAPKRKKMKKTTVDEGETQDNNTDADNNVMPVPPPSKRQKKRQKKEQTQVRNKDKEVEKTIAYLNKWDTNRDEWKYEKLRQIHIQKNIFDEAAIPSEHSDIAIQYLSTSKGHAREIIVKSAEEIIKKIEEEITDDNQEELISSARYERARTILQLMQE